jgi:hypothetical protein
LGQEQAAGDGNAEWADANGANCDYASSFGGISPFLTLLVARPCP